MLRRVGIAAAALAALLGTGLYAAAPGVGSYQASGLLVMPACVLGAIWAYRRIPRGILWASAVVIAPIGPVAYLVWGGDQWWNWGQLTPLPLVALVLGPQFWSDPGDDEPEPFAFVDGPWGPP